MAGLRNVHEKRKVYSDDKTKTMTEPFKKVCIAYFVSKGQTY
jgi:hypothetical protein